MKALIRCTRGTEHNVVRLTSGAYLSHLYHPASVYDSHSHRSERVSQMVSRALRETTPDAGDLRSYGTARTTRFTVARREP